MAATSNLETDNTNNRGHEFAQKREQQKNEKFVPIDKKHGFFPLISNTNWLINVFW